MGTAQMASGMLGHKERKLCPERDPFWRLALASENNLTQGYALGIPSHTQQQVCELRKAV